MSVLEKAKAAQEKVKEWRRHIHACPDIGMETENTAAFIERILCEIGLKEVRRCAGTGVLALIRGTGGGRCVGLRADMDALPVTERCDLPFKSQNEAAHVCGHDIHTACLLGAADILHDMRNEFSGTIKLIFQPGEELAEGAAAMIADGAIEDAARKEPKMDAAFTLHVWPDLPAGTIGVRRGPMLASAQAIAISIKGKQGHAAHPHRCVDPVLIAGHIICALQSIVSREMPPIETEVLTLGKISGGTVGNIIPEYVNIEGTIRALSKETSQKVVDAARRIVEGTASMLRGSATLETLAGLPPVVNDDRLFELMSECFSETFGAASGIVRTLPEPSMGGEDFALFMEHVPGALFRLGVGRDGVNYPLHSPDFFADESGFYLGVAGLSAVALKALKS
ncbi:peptidase M20 [Synergistales bacterium]|nr:peptidase M20 [Synergistales bacterium]